MEKVDLKEIVQSWVNKVNPTEKQKALAEKRLAICANCEKLAVAPAEIRYCTGCGCVIAAKAYSPKENPCPLKKWTCDLEYFKSKVDRNKVV